MVKRKVPPSKQRYDKEHPTISFRVSNDEKERLRKLCAKDDKSFGRFFREALGSEERNYEGAFNRGYARGFDEARSRYAVAPLCVSCMETIFIDDVKLQERMADDLPFTCLHEGCPLPQGVAENSVRRFKPDQDRR